jgi:hypothetical protein
MLPFIDTPSCIGGGTLDTSGATQKAEIFQKNSGASRDIGIFQKNSGATPNTESSFWEEGVSSNIFEVAQSADQGPSHGGRAAWQVQGVILDPNEPPQEEGGGLKNAARVGNTRGEHQHHLPGGGWSKQKNIGRGKLQKSAGPKDFLPAPGAVQILNPSRGCV